MKQLSKVPKIWLSVLLYFILVEIIVLFRKPALAFQPNFIGIRILFFISFIAATAIKKYFKKIFLI